MVKLLPMELVPFKPEAIVGDLGDVERQNSANDLEEIICYGSPSDTLQPVDNCNSCVSLTSTFADACRICHCEAEAGAPFISPCGCSGTLKYVHQACLQQWIKSANTKSCELCKVYFHMTSSVKPFRKWQKLEMTKVERRKLACSVSFHVIALTCVVWSLYVLIDRTADEIKTGQLEWQFWMKLIVVAVGFTGGLVFMYVLCKMYVELCRRWRAYNCVIYVQNIPNGARGAGKYFVPETSIGFSTPLSSRNTWRGPREY